MEVLSITKTKEEDIQLEDYNKDLNQEVYTITYLDDNKNKYTFQCLGGSERFIIFLELYEKKLNRIEEILKKDIKPFFHKEKLRRALFSFPIGLLIAGGIISLWWVLPQNEVTYAILRFSAYFEFIASGCLSHGFVKNVKYNDKDVQTYVPDQNVVNSFKAFSKRKKMFVSLKKKYIREIDEYKRENTEENVEKERREMQRKLLQEKRESAERELERTLFEQDYLDYLALNPAQKRTLYEKALEIRNRKSYFQQDVPSFLKRSQKREKNFLDFALHDEFNLNNTASPMEDYESILSYGSGQNFDSDDLKKEIEQKSLEARKKLQAKYSKTRFYDEREKEDDWELGGRRR